MGLIHFTVSNGAVRRVFAGPEIGSEWRHLSLSPDGKRAVGTRAGRVELIDVAKGTVEYLGGEFFIAAWSPDGKWLAALEKGEHGRTILFDGNHDGTKTSPGKFQSRLVPRFALSVGD